MYNFDAPVERKNTNSYKWDSTKEVFGRDDVLPLWVADMDFKCPQPLLDALGNRIEHGILGYTSRTEGYFEAIMSWMERRHGWKMEREWISYCPPGIMPAVSMLINQLSEEGDGIIIQTPNYTSLIDSIKDNNRRMIENPLVFRDGRYQVDFDDLEAKIDDRTKLLLLCNPNNPTGMVWIRHDLERLGKICKKYGIFIISDEVHCDFVYGSNKHIPLGSVSNEIGDISATCFSPNKTFNTGGLLTASIIIQNEKIRKDYMAQLGTYQMRLDNVFGRIAVEEVYSSPGCEQWLDELLIYIERNIDYGVKRINSIDGLWTVKPEGTYLLWVDFKELGLDDSELRKLLINEAGVGFSDGLEFGKDFGQFMRINTACSSALLVEALNKVESAVKKRKH
jgi:cystathionine beta-lyase